MIKMNTVPSVYRNSRRYSSFLSKFSPVPTLEETWWGPGSPKDTEPSTRPFKINISDQVRLYIYKQLSSDCKLIFIAMR